jgi:hypothetical protein
MDTELEAIKQKERFKELEQQIQAMLLSSAVDYRTVVKELDSRCKYSSQDKLEVVRVLYKIKESGLYDKKKLQKVINHYAIEYDNILVLKP